MKKIKIKSPDIQLNIICSVTNAAEAEILRNTLLDHGIECELYGEHQAGFTGTFDIDVVVRESDTDEARKILLAHHANMIGLE